MTSPASRLPATAAGSAPAVRPIRGLLWREWLHHGRAIQVLIGTWLALEVILPTFFHPGFLLALGLFYALFLAHEFGGADAAEGSEEFSFSLPPTRGERYLVRLALGGGVLGLLLLAGLASVALDLPQALWGLIVESGFTRSFPPVEPRFLYTLSFAAPVAVFAVSFSFAAISDSRRMVGACWLVGLFLSGTALGIGFLLEWYTWGGLNGWLSCPLLLLSGAASLLLGALAYRTKEGVSRPALPGEARGRWGLVLLLVFLVLALLGSFLLFAVNKPGSSAPAPPAPPVRHAAPESTQT